MRFFSDLLETDGLVLDVLALLFANQCQRKAWSGGNLQRIENLPVRKGDGRDARWRLDSENRPARCVVRNPMQREGIVAKYAPKEGPS